MDRGTSECLNGTWTCYTFVRVQKTWGKAKDFCAVHGMVLAGPDSREKADALYQDAKKYITSTAVYFWLGASDTVRICGRCPLWPI